MRILLLCLVFASPYSLANFDWSSYSTLLGQYVKTAEKAGISGNLVDYQGIAQDPRYMQLIETMAAFDVKDLEGNEKLAFYINAYNLLTIKLVIDHKPKGSIKDIGSWFNPVWQKPAGVINGEIISLDTIEHKILRNLNEPRIHFAIVCASLSCPDLRAEAYQTNKLDQQLDEQAKQFINNDQKGLKIEGKNIYISKIFDWFSEDFATNDSEQEVLKYIAQYNIEAGRFSEFKTLNYNWQLNQQ